MTSKRVAVAVSGGRDSMALLHCTARAAQAQSIEVWALHVHHGLQAQADEWAAFVERWCARRKVRFAMRRLEGKPARGQSVEAWARAGRYAALADMAREAGCGAVLLAHHRGDQSETFVLQALRGAGPAGLASMPKSAERNGIAWLRPWLEQPRDAIEAYGRRHRLRFVDDPSNADPRFARNRLRLHVMPALREDFVDAEAALAAAARRCAQASALIEEVAQADALSIAADGALLIARWSALSLVRRREALRAWLAPQVGDVSHALLDRLMSELMAASAPARWPLDGATLVRYRGRLRVQSDAPQHSLQVHDTAEGGVPLSLLAGARWQPREGAEQFQRAPHTPPRSLKKQFQSAAIPAWSRSAPLLVAADGTLVFVPGLGTDARALAMPGTPRVSLEWIPAAGHR
jgi:tRNA(Ile)-lysidine synthase